MTEENPHNFYEVTIPYERIPPNRPLELVSAYRELLKNKVFPAIDKLRSEGLIDTYHFLTHVGLDLRISIQDEEKIPEVKEILEQFEIPTDLRRWDENHERIEVEDHVLRMNTEITRLLLEHPDFDSFYPSVIHYQNNSFGIGNEEETNFYINQGVNWIISIYMQKLGMERPEAIEKTKQDLIKLSENLR